MESYTIHTDPGTMFDGQKTVLIDSRTYGDYLNRCHEAQRYAVCDECGKPTNSHSRPIHNHGRLVGVLCMDCEHRDPKMWEKYYDRNEVCHD